MKNGFYDRYIKLMYLILLNVVFIICCIPVFTIGASASALSYTIYMMLEDRADKPLKQYFTYFREYFRESTVVWLGTLLLGLVLFLDVYLTFNMQGAGKYLMIPLFFAAFILIIFSLYIYPVITLYDTKLKQKIKNAFNIALANLPQSIVMAAIAAVPVLLYIAFKDRVWIPAIYMNFIGISAVFYQNLLIVRKILSKYKKKT